MGVHEDIDVPPVTPSIRGVADLGKALRSGEHPDQITSLAVSVLTKGLGMSRGLALGPPDGQGVLRALHPFGWSSSEWPDLTHWRLNEGEVSPLDVELPVIRSGELRILPQSTRLRSVVRYGIMIAIRDGSSRPIGYLVAFSRTRRYFKEDELAFAQAVGELTSSAVAMHGNVSANQPPGLLHEFQKAIFFLDEEGELSAANWRASAMLQGLEHASLHRILHPTCTDPACRVGNTASALMSGKREARDECVADPGSGLHWRVQLAPSPGESGRGRGLVALDGIPSSFFCIQGSRWAVECQEAERKRIAAELHDSIGQTLSAARFAVEDALATAVPDTACASCPTLLSTSSRLRGAIDETRRIALNLRPSLLDDLGLRAAIDWFLREFHAVYPKIALIAQVELREDVIPLPLKVALFRIIQESLANVAKHAKATEVSIALRYEGTELSLSIEDNGQGFSTSGAPGERCGLGLRGMRERAEATGGTLHVVAESGQGVAIRGLWPLGNRAAGDLEATG